MTERQEQMIFNEGYRRGKAERHKMLDDGTLVVSVDDATAVTRVLVEDGQKNGDLYYADAVSVVRCGECKHMYDGIKGDGYLICHKFNHFIKADDFCSWGERSDT